MTDAADRSRRGPTTPPLLTAVLLAIATGLAWATAHPEPAVWWLVFAVVPGWLTVAHLTRARGRWTTFLVGGVLGLAAFMPMLRWLGGIPSGWVAWPLLSVVLAAYVGAATVVVRPWTTSRWVALVGPLVWTGMEVARARWPLGGFGWGDLASAHTTSSWMLTSARVLGADGLTLLTALLGACAWATVRTALAVRGHVAVTEGRAVVPGAARTVAVVDEVRPLMFATVGVAILGTLVTIGPPATSGSLDVLVVQGSDGAETARGAERDLVIAESHAAATIASVRSDGAPDLTVWAENAIDRDPTTAAGADLREVVEGTTAALDGPLLAGTILDGEAPGTLRNTVTAFGPGAEVLGVYEKQEVVPFGEYVPLRPVLGRLPVLQQYRPTDIVPGDGPVTLEVAGTRVAPIICFETKFGATVRDAVAQDDAGLVVAVTNNARFGRGGASDQHVAQSRLRAVETGRAVVHAAITGVSAVVLPDGTVAARTPLFEVDTIRTTVPLVTGATPAMLVGTPLSWTILVAAVGLAVATPLRTVRERRGRRTTAQEAR